MKKYINDLSSREILKNHERCVIQPHLSGNYQVDLLLRNHNWSGGINVPVELTYKVITNNSADVYQQGFWNNQGKELALSLKYLRDKFQEIGIYEDELPDYIEDDDNRDAYQLYENNFVSSFAQTEYMLSIKFENIKKTIKAHSKHEAAIEYAWIASINSIYDLDVNRLNISTQNLKDEVEDLFSRQRPIASLTKKFSDDKFNQMIKYIFNHLSELANINFKEVEKSEDVTIYAKAIAPILFRTKDDYFSLEYFDYANGKTNHVSLTGDYQVNDKPAFMNMDFSSSLHGIGHIMIDHPNDANIGIREHLLPPDYDWSQRYGDYGIANEYRADNGCMSVMAFTNCFYRGKVFSDALSYMPIDIQALQHMYGVNEKTRSGDTNYILTEKQTFIDNIEITLFPMDILADSIYTLYDASSINTFDLTLVIEAEVDLNQGAGHFNVVGDNVFIIAYGTNISNILLGDGNFKIKLNDLANSVLVPAKGAHVEIESFDATQDHIILYGDVDQNFEFVGCIKPYTNIGDNLTEICFK